MRTELGLDFVYHIRQMFEAEIFTKLPTKYDLKHLRLLGDYCTPHHSAIKAKHISSSYVVYAWPLCTSAHSTDLLNNMY